MNELPSWSFNITLILKIVEDSDVRDVIIFGFFFSDKLRTNNTGIIVAVALAGTLFGIAVSASVFFFMIQRLKKSQNRYISLHISI